MANPLFRNHWNPIRHSYNPQSQIQPQSTKPKVVNIPVHFVGSEIASSKQSQASEEARLAAAVTIQRAVRGFLVRKNARIVRQVATEVEEIERKVREEEDKIRLDARERVLLSETLMALLLRLDSVRDVRDLRKRVIRRVIALQEAIDFIAAADRPISTIDVVENQEDSAMDDENITDQTIHLDEDPEVLRIEVTKEGLIDHDDAANQNVDLVEETDEAKTELEMEFPAEVESPEIQCDLSLLRSLAEEECSVEVDEESSIDHENETGVGIPVKAESPKRETNLIGIEMSEDEARSPEPEQIPKAEEEGRGMREMLERMAVENERLKGLVTQLCETSSEQCRLMKGLAERVDQLERVVHHRMDRRKKRRSSAACSAISSAK